MSSQREGVPQHVWNELEKVRVDINQLAASICPPIDENIPRRDIYNKTGRLIGHFFNMTGSETSPVIFAIHGGGYYTVDAIKTAGMYIDIAKQCGGFNVYVIEYRLVPDVTFPENVKDCVGGYEYLLNEMKVPADQIVVYGDSAGGGLVAYLMNALMGPNQKHPEVPDNLFYQCPKALPQPRGAVMSSPWMNFKMDTPPYKCNVEFDYVDGPFFETAAPFVKYFIQPYTTFEQNQPLGINPTGWKTAVRITAGVTETLFDDVLVFARKLQQSGVNTSFKTFHDLPHCGYWAEEQGQEVKKVVDAFFDEQVQWIKKLFNQRSSL